MGLDNLVPSLVCVLMLTQSIHAVTFDATNNAPNTPGGKVFDQYIGVPYTKQTLKIVTDFIWELFEQKKPEDRKPIPSAHCYVSDFNEPYAYANIPLNAINVSAPSLNKWYYPRERSKFYFKSLMYHEMTHLLQWYQPNGVPGLYEGIADFVMVKSKVYEPEKYTKPGAGNRWDEGYGVTARFLEYCSTIKPNFVAEINKRMRYSYDVKIFQELLGKPVNQLWNDYKAKYKSPQNGENETNANAGPEKHLPWGSGRDTIIP